MDQQEQELVEHLDIPAHQVHQVRQEALHCLQTISERVEL
jgi:hypothetical protein